MLSQIVARKGFFVWNYDRTASARLWWFSASIQGGWSMCIKVASKDTLVDILAWVRAFFGLSCVLYMHIQHTWEPEHRHSWTFSVSIHPNMDDCVLAHYTLMHTIPSHWNDAEKYRGSVEVIQSPWKDWVWQKPSCFWREWTEESQLWRQCVSSTPATRLDVINLQEQLDIKLQQRQARETGICPVRRELYSQCFGEWEGEKFTKKTISYKRSGRFWDV